MVLKEKLYLFSEETSITQHMLVDQKYAATCWSGKPA